MVIRELSNKNFDVIVRQFDGDGKIKATACKGFVSDETNPRALLDKVIAALKLESVENGQSV